MMDEYLNNKLEEVRDKVGKVRQLNYEILQDLKNIEKRVKQK